MRNGPSDICGGGRVGKQTGRQKFRGGKKCARQRSAQSSPHRCTWADNENKLCDRHEILQTAEGPGLIFFTLTLKMVMQKQNNSPDSSLPLPSVPPSYQSRDRSEGKLERYTDVWHRTRNRVACFPPCWQVVGVVCCTSECLHVEACVVSVEWPIDTESQVLNL